MGSEAGSWQEQSFFLWARCDDTLVVARVLVWVVGWVLAGRMLRVLVLDLVPVMFLPTAYFLLYRTRKP